MTSSETELDGEFLKAGDADKEGVGLIRDQTADL